MKRILFPAKILSYKNGTSNLGGHMLRFLFITTVSLFVQSQAWALTTCLYSRSSNDPMAGHAFVTIEDKGRVIETYGLWPKKKHPTYVAINKPSDLPFRVLRSGNYVLPKSMLKLKEVQKCQTLTKSIETVRTEVSHYLQKYGVYKSLTNNCTHFAVRIYNFAADDHFPEVQTPLAVRNILTEDQIQLKENL